MIDSAAVAARGFALALFFLSGATGLVYQVVWTRQLSLVFGVTIFAAAAVLAAFMGGLALGSWLFGRVADRSRNPLRLYAVLEAGIGVAALALPWALRAIEPLYVELARNLGDRFLWLHLTRALLVAVPLAIPTTLMGGTVPAMARFLVRRPELVGSNVGLLYAVNTFGAVAGCLAAGFALVPAFPLSRVVWVTAAVNVGIGVAIWLSRFGEGRPAEAEHERAEPATPWDGAARLAAVVFAVSGFAALGYEILWTRALVVYVHNTNYAFTLMLAIFLAGLALGNALLVRVYDRIARPLAWLGSIQVATGLSVLVAAAAYARLPAVGGDALTSFGGALGLMSLRAAVVLLPTTLLLGTVFPLVARIVCGALSDLGRRLGVAYAANTAGAIGGSLGTAFLLIPVLGLRGTLLLLAGANAVLGAACWVGAARTGRGRAASLAAGALLALAPAFAIPPTLFQDALESGPWRLVFYREGATDTTGVWENADDGGRIVTYGDQRGTAGTMTNGFNRRQAHLAHLLHPRPVRSLQIGFGVGNTLAGAAIHPEVETLDCVELSPQVRETARWFWTNEGVLDDPKVRLVIDDGRNFLLRTTETYDVVTLEPPEIFTADVVNLYTVEFYRLAERALAEGGLISQWIPSYTMGERDMRMAVAALLEVFPVVTLWRHGPVRPGIGAPSDQLLVMAAREPFALDEARLAARMRDPALAADLAAADVPDPPSLLALFVAGTDALERWVADAPPVVDDRTVVDYSTPAHSFAGFGLGPLRLFEGFHALLGPMNQHKRELEALNQRLQQPPAAFPARPPLSDALRLEMERRLRSRGPG